jgi:alcohol dehydrogenase (quinone), cytochrome c subunit
MQPTTAPVQPPRTSSAATSRFAARFALLALTLIVSLHATHALAANDSERGRYLADVGNCVSCHTRLGGEPYAGGVPFATPFGTIYSSNITPDIATGIGGWSNADVRSALKRGIGRNGKHLFPAFPYPSFTKMTDQDANALSDYLKTLRPVRYSPPENGFLFSARWSLAAWNSMYFEEGAFKNDAAKSAEWNRGAYLVQGLGHCGACHTPRNWMMAEDPDRMMSGGILEAEVAAGKNRRWSAANLTSSKNGLAAWSLNDLTKYLQTGFSPRAGSFGPMNEVIANSLSKLSSDDVRAIAVYLKDLPPTGPANAVISKEQSEAGQPVYKEHCEKCHGSSGRGGLFSGPPVSGSAVVQTEDASSLINVILYGPQLDKAIPTGSWESMPAYLNILTDEQIAAVSNYMRSSWGNQTSPVTEKNVADQR